MSCFICLQVVFEPLIFAELDQIQNYYQYVDHMRALAPSESDNSSEESDPGEEDTEYDEIQRHLERFDSLEEPLRSRAFIGLKKLSYNRECMRTNVVECIERRLYQNVYKPSVKARGITVEVGDICLWNPIVRRRKPKSSHRIKNKVVRALRCEGVLPCKISVEFFP